MAIVFPQSDLPSYLTLLLPTLPLLLLLPDSSSAAPYLIPKNSIIMNMSIALNSSARLHALRILITLSLFLSVFSIGATKPEEMPNVQLLDSTRFVSDPASELDPAIRQQIDRSLLDLRRRTTV